MAGHHPLGLRLIALFALIAVILAIVVLLQAAGSSVRHHHVVRHDHPRAARSVPSPAA